MKRLPIQKTYKLFIGGAFPRSESGRTLVAEGANVARASRKDLRDAVRIARQAGVGWAKATAYNRGQVLYRIAEMMETRRAELASVASSKAEVDRAIDRVVWYAGWADKIAQVVGTANPVAGPYFNFTVPEPTGVVGILAPEPPLLGLVSRLSPVIVGGNTAVVIASEAHPLVAIELAECLATADVRRMVGWRRGRSCARTPGSRRRAASCAPAARGQRCHRCSASRSRRTPVSPQRGRRRSAR